eukprot:CAMPEP_0178437870 /NCGR_PEP_ID=MMETSP0689_2-20121128/35248_1 /TAXON_ID=160604 /ORGANISM="Amphidinium massartii, Strain CS-259" /LENGTH=295 /DNA_ID=CAMNT_0020060151 /DNA_START=24 /DNA_END=911 /DNA_ORIENTATION=-
MALEAAKEEAISCEAAGHQAWVEGLGLGSRGVRRSGRTDSYSRALERYQAGLRSLRSCSLEALQADAEALELLGRLHAGCAQVFLGQGIAFKAMIEARRATEAVPSLLQAHLLYANAVHAMERAQEMYYGDEGERRQHLTQAQCGLQLVLKGDPSCQEAQRELQFCQRLLRSEGVRRGPDDAVDGAEGGRRHKQPLQPRQKASKAGAGLGLSRAFSSSSCQSCSMDPPLRSGLSADSMQLLQGQLDGQQLRGAPPADASVGSKQPLSRMHPDSKHLASNKAALGRSKSLSVICSY